ncbi:MAG: outer membrane protein assembly factor BamE [Phenylobacterium sp.]|nr:outer membrane protein assembly factor BamE [Phenylobacterium sp.]
MKYFACLISPLLLAGCVHGDNVERLQAGMDREQVRAVMGPADASTHTPGKDCAYYTVLRDFWSRTPWSMSDRYYVCFTDGKVETYGKATQSAQMTAP